MKLIAGSISVIAVSLVFMNAINQFGHVVLIPRSEIILRNGLGLSTSDLKIAGHLKSGEIATVKWCHDIKSDIIPQVKSASGVTGYIHVGDYQIHYEMGAFHWLPNFVLMSCEPLVNDYD